MFQYMNKPLQAMAPTECPLIYKGDSEISHLKAVLKIHKCAT